MTVRVGVVGVGTIGLAYVRRLHRRVSGAAVVALAAVDVARAEGVVGEVSGAHVFRTGSDLIHDHEVDALVRGGCLKALRVRQRIPVTLIERPAFYSGQ
jgi:predicted dehydrogenase